MTRRRVRVWEQFSGGEAGALGVHGAAANQFVGNNVMVYLDGSIGPRPGLRELAPTGVSNGAVWAFFSASESRSRNLMYGQGTTVYGFDPPDGAAASLGTVATTPTTPQQIASQYGGLGLLAIYGDKGYVLNPTTPTVTAMTGSPAGKVVCQYGERTIIANVAAYPYRVYYSAASDPNSWPALNYFDVGLLEVTFVAELRNRLAIATSEGSWYVLSGVPGVNDSLSRTPREDLAPLSWSEVCRVGEYAYFASYGDTWPVLFTGRVTEPLQYRHLALGEGVIGESVMAAAAIGQLSTVVFIHPDESKMLAFHNQVPTFHELGVTVAQFVTSQGDVAQSTDSNYLFFTDGGSAGAAPTFYAWAPQLERPGKVSDEFASPGDGSDTPLDASIESPVFWTNDGAEFRVESVTVEFQRYDTEAAETNHFDLEVISINRYTPEDTPVATETVATMRSWDEEPSAVGTDGEAVRVVMPTGDATLGHAARLRITNMRGVSLRRVFITEAAEPDRR